MTVFLSSLLLVLGTLACTTPEATPLVVPLTTPVTAPMPTPAVPIWPMAGVPLTPLSGREVAGKLMLDAGHGAAGNSGNTNVRCEKEAEVMRRVADGVATLLAPRLTVIRTRPDANLVSYPDRLKMSRQADWFVSLHSDGRAARNLRTNPTTGCTQTDEGLGFSILLSDEGDAGLVERRRALAFALARRMKEAGFLPYPGEDYTSLYEADSVPGVFLDRHEDRKRIMLLRRPKVPSVIIETHQAWDWEESARWEEPRTWEAFASAIAAALSDLSTK